MSPDHVEIIRRAYELWNADEDERLLESFHPDVVYVTSGVFPGFDPEYRGREGIARFRDEMLEAWERFELEPLDVAVEGDVVTVAIRFVARGRVSGVDVDVAFHHVAQMRDGLIYRFAAHPDPERARAAAGIGA